MVYGFIGDLVVGHIDGNLWVTNDSFLFFSGNFKVSVPRGFITDFASVPWPVSMIIQKSGRHNQAAVLHDYLYSVQIVSRETADLYFLQGMRLGGVNNVLALVMYQAVRWFAWLAWNAKKGKGINVAIH